MTDKALTDRAPQADVPIFRYHGRNPRPSEVAGSARQFDDTALPNTLEAALRAASVGFIDDPMSFPWHAIDLDGVPVLVVDASHCSSDDVTALAPALDRLTPADVVLNPADPTAVELANALGTQAVVPAAADWDQLSEERQVVVHERRIVKRIKRELGDTAIVHRVEPAALTETPGGFGAYLAELSQTVGAQPVGVWGVRSRPGAPLHHGLVAMAAEPES